MRANVREWMTKKKKWLREIPWEAVAREETINGDLLEKELSAEDDWNGQEEPLKDYLDRIPTARAGGSYSKDLEMKREDSWIRGFLGSDG